VGYRVAELSRHITAPLACEMSRDTCARTFNGFFLGPGVPRAYREAKEGPLQDET
jgi:hypothetical protein